MRIPKTSTVYWEAVRFWVKQVLTNENYMRLPAVDETYEINLQFFLTGKDDTSQLKDN